MGVTLGGIIGAVIVANLLTVWLVWGVREFARTRGERRGPGMVAWIAVLLPVLVAGMALIASVQ